MNQVSVEQIAEGFDINGPVVKRDRRTLPFGLRRYRPGIFDKLHGAGSGVLTASQIPALFKQSRFAGRYALAAHILGKVPLEQPSEALVERGRRLEPLFVDMLRDDKGWECRQLRAYAPHRRIHRLISSPDLDAYDRADALTDTGIIETKVVADMVFAERWADEPPLDVQLQHQTQYACTGAQWGAIAALVIGTYRFDLIVYETKPDPDAIAVIEDAATQFLAMLDAGQMPEPDDHRTSLAALAKLYPEVDPGKVVRFSGEDASESERRWDAWNQARLDRLASEKIEEAAQNWFFTKGPDAAQFSIGNDRTVNVKVVNRKESTRVIPAGSYRKWSLKRDSDEE